MQLCFSIMYANPFLFILIYTCTIIYCSNEGAKDKESALAKFLLEEALSSFTEPNKDVNNKGSTASSYEELVSSKKDNILRYHKLENASDNFRKSIVESRNEEDVSSEMQNKDGMRGNSTVIEETGTKRNAAIFLMEPRRVAADFLANRRFLDTSVLLQDAPSHERRVIQGRCNVYRKCPDEEYCDGMFCYECRRAGEHCDLNGECCEQSECQYGVCTEGVSVGDPGTFCDLSKDCKGDDVCCIHEISISKMHSICKPMLNEHESCGPINLFHQDVMKATLEPICGPCKKGLSCKGIGILGRHSICLPDNEE